MSSIFKSFFDDQDMLYCDNGIWKTGYEELSVEVSGVCVTNGMNFYLFFIVLGCL